MSQILSWLGQSAVAATLLAGAVYLARNLIKTRLARSVQHEFDKKLATFRNELDQEARRTESVRNAAFAASLAQRTALTGKRIEAAQSLWEAILYARNATFLVMQFDLLKLDAVVPELNDPKMQKFLRLTAGGEVMGEEFINRLHKHAGVRPFVSPTAWALYSVYSAIVATAVGKMKALQAGQDPRKFFREIALPTLLSGVLPDEEIRLIWTDSEHGSQWVLSRIEERVVTELQRSLAETSAGLDSVADAQRILQATDKAETSRLKELIREDAPPGALKS